MKISQAIFSSGVWIDLRPTERNQARTKMHDLRPEVDDHGHERPEVERDVERLVEVLVRLEVVPVPDPGDEDQVARRGDRQQLGRALDDPERERLPVGELARLLAHAEGSEDDRDGQERGSGAIDESAPPHRSQRTGQAGENGTENRSCDRLVKIQPPRGEDRLRDFSTRVENGSGGTFYDEHMPRKTLQFEAGDPFELPAVGGRALPRRDFTEIFYDTAGGRLGLAGFVLRRRIENGKGLWRLSVVCDGVPTLDVEAPGGPAGPPEELRELVSAASAGFELAPVLRARTHATGLRVKAGSRSLAKISVASIALLDGQRTTGSFSEIELEQLAATRKELARLESALRKSGAKPTNGAGPLEQALAREPQPELPLPSTSLEQLRPYLREQYARMLAHDPGVRVGKRSRGPASDARRNAAAALGAEHGRADPRPGLGGPRCGASSPGSAGSWARRATSTS